MSTTTLLVVIGFGVLVKTTVFICFAVRRGRRQRVALEAAHAAADDAAALLSAVEAAAGLAPQGWRLQWAEPGVLLVENIDHGEGVRDVKLVATLTSGCGQSATLTRAVRFIGGGACFEARFADLEGSLAAELGGAPDEARRRLACTLDYAMVWRTGDGETHRENRVGQAVVPVPDLALGLA